MNAFVVYLQTDLKLLHDTLCTFVDKIQTAVAIDYTDGDSESESNNKTKDLIDELSLRPMWAHDRKSLCPKHESQ